MLYRLLKRSVINQGDGRSDACYQLAVNNINIVQYAILDVEAIEGDTSSRV